MGNRNAGPTAAQTESLAANAALVAGSREESYQTKHPRGPAKQRPEKLGARENSPPRYNRERHRRTLDQRGRPAPPSERAITPLKRAQRSLRRRSHVEPSQLENLGFQFADVLVVVDHEHAGRVGVGVTRRKQSRRFECDHSRWSFPDGERLWFSMGLVRAFSENMPVAPRNRRGDEAGVNRPSAPSRTPSTRRTRYSLRDMRSRSATATGNERGSEPGRLVRRMKVSARSVESSRKSGV